MKVWQMSQLERIMKETWLNLGKEYLGYERKINRTELVQDATHRMKKMST
jgi:hypothetical protein